MPSNLPVKPEMAKGNNIKRNFRNSKPVGLKTTLVCIQGFLETEAE